MLLDDILQVEVNSLFVPVTLFILNFRSIGCVVPLATYRVPSGNDASQSLFIFLDTVNLININ